MDDASQKNEDNDSNYETQIVDRVISSYGNKEELETIQYHLQEGLRSGANICLVCIDDISKHDSIWSCETCHCSFHLGCIQKWAKDSIYIQIQAQDENMFNENLRTVAKKGDFKWFCPKCRQDYPNASIPYEYTCFCGKLKNPKFDPWIIPHSCGERCSKNLKPNCGHFCLLLCHPGPCPPCPVMIINSCHCLKAKPKARRCSSKTWSCNSICERYLACKQHRCKYLCHPGLCSLCVQKSNQKCQCGNSFQLRPCNDLNWQCKKVCGSLFSCSHHKCELVCHKGACGDCPKGGKRTCPCGKKTFFLPCTDSVPTCGDTCSKPLACGAHFCAERCHNYSCPSCMQVQVKKCNCGSRQKELPCSKYFACEVKCKRKRDCGKHFCNKKCCTGDCSSCDQICGKSLTCGQHKCESRCHQTKCFPCPVTHRISCSCGGTSITVPCGREKKSPIPICNILCKKNCLCHHLKMDPHKCHEGRCPTCKFICGLKLRCNHTCASICHDLVEIKISKIVKRSGPWEKLELPRTEIKMKPCPPCKVIVPVTCFGKHKTIEVPCYKSHPYSCDRECNRELKCSHHKCLEKCHIVIGAENDIFQGTNCKPCDKPCLQIRPEGCKHICPLPCHPDSCPKCKEMLQMMCHCGILRIQVDCYKWSSSCVITREKMRSCTNQCSRKIACGHRCQKKCHESSCSLPEECRKKVAVRCPCKRLRKDVLCHLASSGLSQVVCDDTCIAIANEEEKKIAMSIIQKKNEEKMQLLKEMENYERLFGRRKKKKKQPEIQSDDKSKLQGKKFFICAIFFSFFSFMAYYFYSISI